MIQLISKFSKQVAFLPILLTLISCTNKQNINWLVLDDGSNNTYLLNRNIDIKITSEKDIVPDSIIAKLNGQIIAKSANSKGFTISANAITKVGKKYIDIIITKNNNNYLIKHSLVVLSNRAPKKFTYKIINTYPHNTSAFTQGLEYNYLQNNNTLFESTGLYGESKLKIVDIKSGKTTKEISLEPQYFGEGLTIFKNKLFLLSWRENIGFIYNPLTFEQIGTFAYQQSKEGWGLTNDGVHIYKSDGTENIWILDNTTLKEISHFEVYDNKGMVAKLNELEFIDGNIYANVFQTNNIVIINPKTGAIDGLIDLSGILKDSDKTYETDVLNGIAYDKHTKRLFVTGKKWPKLFEIKIKPK